MSPWVHMIAVMVLSYAGVSIAVCHGLAASCMLDDPAILDYQWVSYD